MSDRLFTNILLLGVIIFSSLRAQDSFLFSGYISDAVYRRALDNVTLTILAPADTINLQTRSDGFYEGQIKTTAVAGFEMPKTCDLISQNYPNPFNPATTIKYGAPGRLEVFDVTGKLVHQRELLGGTVRLGFPLAGGVYFYRFSAADGQQITKKMVLLDGSFCELHLIGRARGTENGLRKETLPVELPVRFLISRPEYRSIDTVITLISGQENRNNFSLRMVNYPPVTKVPLIRVNRNNTSAIILSKYVSDPDNLPSEMDWNATNYDTSLVSIIIEGDTAKITNKDRNGSTPVTWIATDPAGAAGQNTSQIRTNPSYKVSFSLQDPVDQHAWAGMPFEVKSGSKTYQLTSGPDGKALLYLDADTARVMLSGDDVFQTIMPFDTQKKDTSLVVPVVHSSFPIADFCEIQSHNSHRAYITQWDPSTIIKGTNGAIDTLRTVYIERTPLNHHLFALIDTVRSWNEKYFKHVTGGKYVLQVPKKGQNVIWSYANSLADEVAAEDSICDSGYKGVIGLLSHFGASPGSCDNANKNDPNKSHWATLGTFIALSSNSMHGTHLAEMGTLIASLPGEIGSNPYKQSIYGGGAFWPPFTSSIVYNGKAFTVEQLLGSFKHNLPTGTKIDGTSIILPK